MQKEHAAGGVVFRTTPSGIDLLMITDRFGRLTLPKGKLEPGESSRDAGLREIFEETGIHGDILAELLTVKYCYEDSTRGLVHKQVDYYLIKANSESITPQLEEITTASWVPLQAALERCGYENNLPVLNKARKILDKTNSL